MDKTKIIEYYKKNKVFVIAYSLILAVFVVMLFLFNKAVKASFFVIGFIMLNIFISSYKRNFQLPIEIEILTLGIVLCTLKYGLTAGLVIAIFGTLLSSVLYGYVSPFLLPVVIGNCLIAIVIPFVSTVPVLSLSVIGIIACVLKNLFMFIVYHYLFSYNFGKNMSFSLSNVLLNVVVFLNVAPFIYSLM